MKVVKIQDLTPERAPGMEKSKDWKAEFCRASYEYGLKHPKDCNVIFACIGRE